MSQEESAAWQSIDIYEEDLQDIDLKDIKDVGKLGELLAARYLKDAGYEDIVTNYRCIYGEADIVCSFGNTIVMVEVKTRTNKYVFPEEKVTGKKIQKYRNICLNYLMHHNEIENIEFDVIAINVLDEKHAKLCHIAGISEWDY